MERGFQCATIRFLNAACFLPAVRVLVGNREVTGDLGFGEVSDYCRITAGFRRVSVVHAQTGEELWSETMPFPAVEKKTLVICNTMNSVSVIMTEENGSLAGRGKSCIRLGNFSFDEGPFHLLLRDGTPVFKEVCPREVTRLCPAQCGAYEFALRRQEDGLDEGMGSRNCLELATELTEGRNYTLCVLGAGDEEFPLRFMLLEF